MNRKKAAVVVGILVLIAGAMIFGFRNKTEPVILTGLVTTEDTVVAPEVAGRLQQLAVREGDSVLRGQPLAEIQPSELQADQAYYARSATVFAYQAKEGAAALRYQQKDTEARIQQAAANLQAAQRDRAAAAAQLENAKLAFERHEHLLAPGVVSQQDRDNAKRDLDQAQARADSMDKQVEGQQAALQIARAGLEQIAQKRAALDTAYRQQEAATAQREKAEVRLGYARLTAPINGVVNVRAAREGEFVTVGQPVVELVNPDDFWIRADVEESLIGNIRLGDKLRVKLASGEEREGMVFYRGVDPSFATQRDVSRAKRDIRTFEIRLRVDNSDRRLALGSTAYVTLPIDEVRH